MRISNGYYAMVLVAFCLFLVIVGVWALMPQTAGGSCLRCVEPVPQAKEHESDRGIDAYPGPMPPLAPTPHPYPGHEWADDCYPVPDDNGGHTWVCEFR